MPTSVPASCTGPRFTDSPRRTSELSPFSVSSGRSLDSTLSASLNVLGRGNTVLDPVSLSGATGAFSAMLKARSVKCFTEETLYTVSEPRNASAILSLFYHGRFYRLLAGATPRLPRSRRYTNRPTSRASYPARHCGDRAVLQRLQGAHVLRARHRVRLTVG